MTVGKRNVVKFNVMLNKLKLTDAKRDLIYSVTAGRSEHTLDMTEREMTELLDRLKRMAPQTDFERGNKKRRRILAICHQLPPQLGFTKWNEKRGKRVVDMNRLDDFLCSRKSIFNKKLNNHTSAELSRVIVQFENILKGYLKK